VLVGQQAKQINRRSYPVSDGSRVYVTRIRVRISRDTVRVSEI